MAGLLYVKLDASYSDDEKIIVAGEKAELLYLRGLCLAKRILSDGFIADVHLARFGLSGVGSRAQRLCAVGLWERDDDAGGFWIVAWLKHNRSADEVAEVVSKRREAGRRGGKQRARQIAKQSASRVAKQTRNPEEVDREEAEKILASDKPPRKQDAIFDALIDACGLDVDSLTKSARGAANTAAKELRDVGASPEGIRQRARVYQSRWPDMECTPTALAKHYAQLGGGRPKQQPCRWCGDVENNHAFDCPTRTQEAV